MFVMSMCLNESVEVFLDGIFSLHAENYSYHSQASQSLFII